MTPFAFHAAPPPGHWFNDPNALFFADGRYHLMVQHAADAPDFRRIGWGHLTSADLQEWRWEGVALAPDTTGSAYSGCVVVDGPERSIFFTHHDPVPQWQTQRRARLVAGQAQVEPGGIGPAGRNMRDPFVIRDPDGRGWRMLVAAPCDWTEWRNAPASRLQQWRSDDLRRWRRVGDVGPWSPRGVMWEVPALVDFGEVQALLLSQVDRRRGMTDCSVRYWLGRLDDNGFATVPGQPATGCLLDIGPDFYAAVPSLTDGWPGGDQVVVAWASSWQTARLMPWPNGMAGGPVAMPRRLTATACSRLRQDAALSRQPNWRVPLDRTLTVRSANGGNLSVSLSEDHISVRCGRPGLPDHQRMEALTPRHRPSEAIGFVDGGLIEILLLPDGPSITAVLPGDDPIDVVDAAA